MVSNKIKSPTQKQGNLVNSPCIPALPRVGHNIDWCITIESIVFHSSSGAIQHGARSQNMTYFRLQFFIGPSITMLYPILVYISALDEARERTSVSWMHSPCSGHADFSHIREKASDWTVLDLNNL
jgi:hypothetical protein